MKRFIMTLTTSCLLGACSGAPDPSTTLTDVLNRKNPELGSRYNHFADEYQTGSCLDTTGMDEGDYEYIPPKFSEYKLKVEMSRKEARELLDVNGSAKLNMESLSVSGMMQVAEEMASDNLSSVITVYAKALNGKYAITDNALNRGHVKFNQTGKSALNGTPDDKKRKCGTGFVKALQLSASLVASLRIHYGTEARKNEIRGSLHGTFGDGAVEVGANGRSAIENAVRSGYAEIKISQRGIKIDLPDTITESMIQCNNKQDAAACTKTMIEFLKAAKTASQSVTPETNPRHLWISGTEIGGYSDIKSDTETDPEWDQAIPDETTISSLIQSRITMNDAFLHELQDKNRVRGILASGLIQSIKHRDELFKLQQSFDSRMRSLAKSVKPCYNILGNPQACEKAADTYTTALDEIPVDRSLLVIVPRDFMGFCAKLKNWHTTAKGTDADNPGNPQAAEIDMSSALVHSVSEMLRLEPITKYQDDRAFSEDLDGNKEGYWSPSGKATDKHSKTGQSYWDCIALSRLVHQIEEKVDLSDRHLVDISPMISLQSATGLDLSNNKIRFGLSALGKLDYLVQLTIDRSKLKVIQGATPEGLRFLSLVDNLLDNEAISALANHFYLEEIDLTDNRRISSLEGLINLPSLRQIIISGTSVSKAQLTEYLNKDYKLLNSQPQIVWNGEGCASMGDAVRCQ